MIPPKSAAEHINFPEFFIDEKVEHLLGSLKEFIDQFPTVSDIVLNFEKCQWFEIFPLARLLNILCNNLNQKPIIHIVGPFPHILPYLHDYISGLNCKIDSGHLQADEEEKNKFRVRLHSDILPKLRGMAGAFLVGWGVFDLLENIYSKCKWYTSRDKEVSIEELREFYLFGYGAFAPRVAHASDRIWPFSAVYRTDQEDMLERMNGEELVMGALKKYAGEEVIEAGIASNVFFFEPFENVFQHAFLEPNISDCALVAMRVVDWIYAPDRKLKPEAQRWIAKVPNWLEKYIRFINCPFMEIIITDCGQGISETLVNPERGDFIEYCRTRNIISSEEFWKSPEGNWEAIKYAFEPYSTRKHETLPGRRGLAWLKEKMEQSGGAIQVLSNRGNYILADLGDGLKEIPCSETGANISEFSFGTCVRIIFPLRGQRPETLERFPRWGRILPSPTIFSYPTKVVMIPVKIPSKLADKPLVTDWDILFTETEDRLGTDNNHLAVMDFNQLHLTRVSLESFFIAFMRHSLLQGKTLAINCHRHVVCRLDTIEALDLMRAHNLLLPIFGNDLRMYWAGASLELERTLLRFFHRRVAQFPLDLVAFAEHNSGYFIWENDTPIDFSFRIEEVEAVVRESIGYSLIESLEKRNVVLKGRYVLPTSGKTVSTYVEPHQLFSDGRMANLLCGHLALLLRWQYRRLVKPQGTNIRVLTATRIGRDIAMRMPEAFDAKAFVYYDYHLVKPERTKLLKHLTGNNIVIVVDIVSTGSTVRELIEICNNANSEVLGIVSFIDFSQGDRRSTLSFQSRSGQSIEHKTFLRLPQVVSEPIPGDIPVDKYTLSVSPVPGVEREILESSLSVFSRDRGLRMLEDSQAIHYGHYDLFGHHFEFVVNVSRLLTTPSPQLEDILNACEKIILKGQEHEEIPTAIVLYPDLSNAHILHGLLERRPRLKRLVQDNKLRLKEARRGYRARGLRYWLTKQEVEELRTWTQEVCPKGYSVLVLDDGASSGDTLLALLNLARELKPKKVETFVLINRMPHFQAIHHGEIERFEWAASNFGCLLHLNIPVFSRDSCPLCRERTKLTRELYQTDEEWFREQVRRRLAELEVISALNPQDLPEGPFAEFLNPQDKLGGQSEEYLLEIPPFSWDQPNLLPGRNQTVISRVVSARTAINDGVPIIQVLEEISQQPNDDIFRLVAIEIARRVDLLQAQRVEKAIIELLIKVVSLSRKAKRRAAAIEALRYMGTEMLFQYMGMLLREGLKDFYDEDLIVDLMLLMRRVFSSTDFSEQQIAEEKILLEKGLDNALSTAAPGSRRRSAIEFIRHELVGTNIRMDLVNVIRDLEKSLKTHKSPHHQILYRLSEYIADGKKNIDTQILSTIEGIVLSMSLSPKFVQLLGDINRLRDKNLSSTALKAYDKAQDLRNLVNNHMKGKEIRTPRELRDKMEELVEICNVIGSELGAQLVDPAVTFEEAFRMFLEEPRECLKEIKLNITFNNHLSGGVLIIIDRAIFLEITNNLISNLRHALDKQSNIISANFLLESVSYPGPQIKLEVKCDTQNKESVRRDTSSTTTDQLLQDASPYGVEHFVSQDDGKYPWEENWRFWRF